MSARVARGRVADIDPELPYYDADDFVADVAALTSLYWSEVDITTRMQGMRLYHFLYNMTKPQKVQLYINSLRVRHSLPVPQRHLHTSGTKSVEALNFQCNEWFRRVHELHVTTLELQLQIFQYVGLKDHMTLL